MLQKLLPLFILAIGISLSCIAQNQYTSTIYLQNADNVTFKSAVLLLREQDGLNQVNHRSLQPKEDYSIIHFSYNHENSRMAAMQLLINEGYAPFIYGSNFPADFPLPMNNNTKEDKIRYAEAKQQWIEENPALYLELNQQSSVQIIPQAEFDLMPIEKQEAILANPDLYLVQ